MRMDDYKVGIGAEVPLESVLCTEQLELRPSRAPDYQAEIHALLALLQELKDAPHNVLQKLVEAALALCRGHSAGISLLESGPPGHLNPKGDLFRWHAVAGQWAPMIWNTTTRRDNGPCGTVLDRDCALLFANAHRHFSQFACVQPRLIEALLVPFHVDGQAVGTVWVVAHDDSRKFDAEDRRLLDNLATFAATAYQALVTLNTSKQQAEEALRESDAFSRSIIKSSPDCIKVLDLEGNLLSMQSGQELLGIEDIRPFLNKSWIEFWEGEHRQAAQAAIALATAGKTGKFVGFFRTLRGEPKWWDVVVSPILDANGKPARLLAVSRDVTRHRQAELNVEFLASLSRDLLNWTRADEMMQTVGAKMAAYFQLSICAFAEINETAQQVVINHDWHREDVPSLAGVYRLADFMEETFIPIARAGEVIVVRNVVTDSRTDAEKFATLKIASFVCVPLIRDGQWRFALCLYKSAAYDWRDDEIALTRELTTRIWMRLESLRAEAALRESEKHYRTLFESIDEGFCIIEKVKGEAHAPLDFRYVEANPAFEVQSGWRNVVGKTMLQLVTDVSEEWSLTYDAVLCSGKPIRFEREFVEMGRVRVLELYAFRDEADTHPRVAVLFKDITMRKQAEQALRQRTAQFETLLDVAPLGIYLIDADFRIRHANPVAMSAFGNIPDVIGRDFAEVMHILLPEARANEHLERFRHTLATGKPYVVSELIEKRVGQQMVEYYDWQINRIPLPEGSYGVVCYFREVSERVLAQQKILDSEERHRDLFNSIDEGFCIIEMIFDEHQKPVDWRFLEVNPSFEKHTGISEITGKRMRELIPDHEAYWFETYGKVALTGEPVRFTREAKAMDGRWFDLYAFRVGGRDSYKVAVLFTNITERKRAESELSKAIAAAKSANLAKSDFLSSMSHELRTPLSAILGFAQLIESSSPGPTAFQKRSVDQILKAGWYLLDLINEILDLALIESGKLSLSMEPVSLAEVMLECEAMMEPPAQKRAISLNFPHFDDPCYVKADRTRTKQVIVNLLSNAIKYNTVGESVSVDCTAAGHGCVRVSIKDAGAGLTAEQCAQLFQPFNRLGQDANEVEGTGIGLVLSKRLVELMGGVIGVESSVGKGSVFWIELNLTAAPQLGAGHGTAAVPAQVQGHALVRTLLYVEDNPANLMLVEEIIARRPDIHLLSAPDGRTGVKMALTSLPDVILMDINLPGISGVQVMQILAEDPATAHIPVVALSANAMPRDIEKGLEAGFFSYLTKPIKVNNFMDTLDVAFQFAETQSLHSARTNLEEKS